MKTFFKKILYLLPIPIIIIAVNYFEDPANLFQNGKYESGVAQYLSEGYNVANVVNYNERLLQKEFIEKMHSCPDVIVLGSSKIMLIDSSFAPAGKLLINNGVSGATLEDFLAIINLYETKGCKPKKVIMGLDPWILNDNHGQVRWRELENEYHQFENKLLGKPAPTVTKSKTDYKKYKQLVSLSYFNTAVGYIIHGIEKKYKPTKDILNPTATRLKDGSISYGEDYRNPTPEFIKQNAREVTHNEPIYSLGNYIKFSEDYKKIFSLMVEYLQKQNIEVEFVLVPYHPIVYDYFRQNNSYHIVFDTEKYFKEFAAARSIKLYGSYDPAQYNLENISFYDAFHTDGKAMKTIMQNPSQK